MENQSRKLAFLLRHDKTYPFDKHGWRSVEDLITNHQFTMTVLETIVLCNDKNRFEFSDNKKSIRARQGHSIQVDVNLQETYPPLLLYHGTAEKFLSSILQKGILSGNRQYVHLSETEEDAYNIGKRHGTPVVLKINAQQMYRNGYKFYLSKNGVWLTEFVDAEYISFQSFDSIP